MNKENKKPSEGNINPEDKKNKEFEKNKEKEVGNTENPSKEIPVIPPSFIPEPGHDTVKNNNGEGKELQTYEEPLPANSPIEIGESKTEEF